MFTKPTKLIVVPKSKTAKAAAGFHFMKVDANPWSANAEQSIVVNVAHKIVIEQNTPKTGDMLFDISSIGMSAFKSEESCENIASIIELIKTPINAEPIKLAQNFCVLVIPFPSGESTGVAVNIFIPM